MKRYRNKRPYIFLGPNKQGGQNKWGLRDHILKKASEEVYGAFSSSFATVIYKRGHKHTTSTLGGGGGT